MNLQPPPAPVVRDAAILGLDNVPLELPLAGIGSRTLAAALDYLMLFCLIVLWWLTGMLGLAYLDLGTGWVFTILGFGSFIIQWGYFAILEMVMDGKTPGKHAVGLRVVSYHGGKSSAAAILVRNLIRTVDVLVGLPVMAIDRRARRPGDFVAGTLVVHDRELRAGELHHLGRLPTGWGAREIAVVESFLRRAALMEEERARRLASQLLAWIDRQQPEFLPAAWASAPDPVRTLREALAAGRD
jgi:uncharacterized RDD family membrane protein YckC